MKKIIISLLILLPRIIVMAQWNESFISSWTPNNDIDFISPERGLAVGPEIIKTTNGGEEWIQVSYPMFGTYRIQMINDSVAIGTADSKIIKTTDFGNSWTVINPGIWDQIVSIFFVDSAIGYASTITTGIVLKTIDGGENWSQVSIYEWDIITIYFTNPLIGYAAGGGLKKTTDGGASWSILNINTTGWLQCIHFINSDTGFVGGLNGIFMTTNAGITWTQKANSTTTSIDFADQKNGYASGYGGRIYKTTNSGLTWANLGSLTSEEFRRISVCDSAIVYALSAYGKFFKTTDAGQTWINQYPNEEIHNYESIFFTNQTNGFIAGHLGNIFKTTNAGYSWLRSFSGTGKNLYSFYFINENEGYAVGSNGTLIKTTNSGLNWVKKSSWTNTDLKCITFCSQIIGLAAGDSGTLIKTYDGGENWILIPLSLTNNLNSLVFISDSIGFIVGDGGLLSKTFNRGETWDNINLGVNIDFNTIYFANPQLGYVAGDSGAVFKTTNAGNSWELLDTQSDKNIHSIFFVDEQIGYTAGNSAIRVTPNGGSFWGNQYFYEPIQFNSIIFTNPSTGYAVSKDGLIFKTTNGGGSFVPVELISFAANVSENNVNLSWSTATELNNLGFEIQRSSDKTNWATIGFREGKGTTTEPQKYSYSDDLSDLTTSKLYYRLKQIDFNGSFEYSAIVEVNIAPTEFSLSQNYPNPFNPSTKISWQSPIGSWQTLKVYDVLGKEVATLVDEYKPAGSYNVEFRIESLELSSGIYFYQLKAGAFIETKKMLLIK